MNRDVMQKPLEKRDAEGQLTFASEAYGSLGISQARARLNRNGVFTQRGGHCFKQQLQLSEK